MFNLRGTNKRLLEELKTFRSALVFPPSDAAVFCFRDNLFPSRAYPLGYERIARLILAEWEHAINLYCFKSVGPVEVCKIILSFY